METKDKTVPHEANRRYYNLKQEILLLHEQLPIEYKLMVAYQDPPAFGGRNHPPIDITWEILSSIDSLEAYKRGYGNITYLRLMNLSLIEAVRKIWNYINTQKGMIIKSIKKGKDRQGVRRKGNKDLAIKIIEAFGIGFAVTGLGLCINFGLISKNDFGLVIGLVLLIVSTVILGIYSFYYAFSQK